MANPCKDYKWYVLGWTICHHSTAAFALPYLILGAIGCGNVSTYLLLRRYRDVNNKNNDRNSAGYGQFIVGLISLIAIPIVFEVQTSMFIVREDIAVMLSRILISFAYAVGGIYAVRIKR